MGVVHLAQGSDGRRVALKVLRPHIVGDDEARERLAREVSSLRRVTSPRIAEIIDADPWGHTPFVATRYVPGLTLHEHVKQEGPIGSDDLRGFAAGLAEAVIAVHSVGVLHRDIKPSNVLLEGRAPVLIDFGLARLAEDPRLTATGWLLGTPGYLAPEILYGDDATAASDVHSWAATVAFAATGRPPFGNGPAMAIMDRVRRGEHDLAGVPEHLLSMIEQCLSANPADRPETTAVLADLRAPDGGTGADRDAPTMPFALFATRDDDRTDLLEPDQPAQTRPLTVRTPQEHLAAPAHQPARAPYMAPAPPTRVGGPPPYPPHPHAQHPYGRSGTPAENRPPLSGGVARLQRAALLLGLLGLVAVGFALAPYLAVATITVATLVVRTISWTADSARGRRLRRGRTRWYDGLLAALMSPWYLVVATGGTVLLLLCALTVTLVVGLGYFVFGLAMVPGLLLMGTVLGSALWWGPGSRRLREPIRLLFVRASRANGAGWASVGILTLVIGLGAFVLGTAGVSWAPQPGPPWREGTLLSDVVGLF